MSRLIAGFLALVLALPAWAGASRNFDGAGDFLENTSFVNQTSPFTLGCWVKADASANGVAITLHDGSLSFYAEQVQEGTSEGIAAAIRNGGTSQTIIDAQDVPASDWTWMSVSWAGTTSTSMYSYEITNGFISNTLTTTPPTVQRVRIGTGIAGANAFEGNVAHCAVWDKQLSETEEDELAEGLIPYMVGTANLLGYWPIWGQSAEPDKQGGADLTVTDATSSEDGPPVWTPQ